MRDLTAKTSIGRVFHVLLKTARWPWGHKQGCDGPKAAVTYDDIDDRDVVGFNKRLTELRALGKTNGFVVVDLDNYKDNCSGHFIRITDPIQFRILLEDISSCDLKRVQKLAACESVLQEVGE